MVNHLRPFPEASVGPEWQEQTVRAVGGQGELQEVTQHQGSRKPQAPQAPLAENGGQIRISQKILGRCNKKNNYCNIFLFYYFEIGRLAFQSGTNSRRTTFSGGVGVHILKFIWQKILPEKNPACRQFEVFSSPGY